jgi:hypothetical protein
MQHRQSHYDVTNTVKVSDPREVGREVCRIVRALCPDADLKPLIRSFEVFTNAYAGTLPGYHGCDTWYHDAQHSLDVALAMARLADGHERSAPARDRLGARRVQLGIICALFHDVGYLRRLDENGIRNGAELTLCHVSRSGEFLADFLPTVGFAREAAMARQLVHYTGYEMALDAVKVKHRKDRRLGFLLGTADLLAQMADRAYPEKCRDFLYQEFERCGLAGAPRPGRPAPLYASPQDLLRKTPEFARKLFTDRLDGYFEGGYRYFEHHFGGRNPYLAEVRRHLDYIRDLIARDCFDAGLRRQPECVNATALRRMLGIPRHDRRRPRARVPLGSRRTRSSRGAPPDFIPA